MTAQRVCWNAVSNSRWVWNMRFFGADASPCSELPYSIELTGAGVGAASSIPFYPFLSSPCEARSSQWTSSGNLCRILWPYAVWTCMEQAEAVRAQRV